MQLQLSTWPEVELYLARSKAILIPVGSIEQHGPTGLLGTDALCAEVIGRGAGEQAGLLVGPTFSVGEAQHHMGFAGSITLRPSTMIAAMVDWAQSLAHHGFERLYWLNGHGGNTPTINAAFSEVYRGITFGRGGAGRPQLRCMLRNWWELPSVDALCRKLFPAGEGSHATPSEVSVTYFAHPEAKKYFAMDPKVAPEGLFYDAADYRQRFPDGRIGSDPSQASVEAGAKLVAAAVADVIADFQRFAET